MKALLFFITMYFIPGVQAGPDSRLPVTMDPDQVTEKKSSTEVEENVEVMEEEKIVSLDDLGMEFVRIKGDPFIMGSPKDEAGRDQDEKEHEVWIDYDFKMMTAEVTQRLYWLITKKNPSVFQELKDCPDSHQMVKDRKLGRIASLCPNHPVENLDFSEVTEFIALLNQRFGVNYRLPTEAEWELAARAGSQAAYYYGENPLFLNEYAIFTLNSGGQTQPVGPKRRYANRPNANGLYDMSGNVWEWTQDWYTESPTGGLNPRGPSEGNFIVIRGGDHQSKARYLRSANRAASYGAKDQKRNGVTVGFRLVRVLR